MGRFVTRRRGTVATKPKNPKVSFNLFSSSDDSVSGALSSSRVLKPKGRKVSPAIAASSAENSQILSGISSFPLSTLKEIPLNVLSDRTFACRPRKPIFCSTPSAGHFPNRPCLKSKAVSCSAGVLNPLQHDLDSLGCSGLHSNEKLCLSFGEQETSGDLFAKTKKSNLTSSCGKGGIEKSVVTENNMGEGSLNGNLFSSDSLESSSHFLSTTGDGANRLIDALKEKCLHVPCTVQLDRLYSPIVTQLLSQATYSSCSGHSHKGYSCQISEASRISPSPSKKLKGESTSAQCVKTSRNATRDKKRSTSTDRSGTLRKACVSGLSVNRWKNKDSSVHTFKKFTADGRSNRTVDCSVSEMISAKPRKQNQVKVRHKHTLNERRHA